MALYRDCGKYEALGCILETIAHELSHYFQWVNQLPLTQIGEERQATRYAKLIMNEYIDAYGILGEVGTSKLFTAETQEDLVMKVQTIQHCLKNHIAASVYYDTENRGKHFTGYIVGHDNEHLLIAHISAHGLYDGFILKRIEDIYRIDYDGSYEKKIDTLYRVKQQSHPDAAEITKSDSILKNALCYARDHKLIVSVLFQEFFFPVGSIQWMKSPFLFKY